LDDVVEDLDVMAPGLFLKLDVQGGEQMVLEGAPKVLAASTGLMTEFSLVSLYEDQPPSRDLLETIYAADFEIWDALHGYRNPNTHRLNQVDLICFKKSVS
ncbi:MAG: FkbM family methyltransferase, partial [Pseudomonadota bacterium]